MKLLWIAGACVALSGCATKDFVNERVGAEGARLDSSIASVNSSLSATISANDKRYEDRFSSLQNANGATTKLAQDALARANAAHKLAEGKLLAETILTDDKFRFQFGAAKVNKEAETMLGDLVSKLKAENKNVYIEIQGHTDRVGSTRSNLRLGQERADAVRQYLHKAGIPLHRINTVSYGETQLAATGKSRQAHSQNRRVVVMVLI
jgi:peptidoglycan-associated lipoprotein